MVSSFSTQNGPNANVTPGGSDLSSLTSLLSSLFNGGGFTSGTPGINSFTDLMKSNPNSPFYTSPSSTNPTGAGSSNNPLSAILTSLGIPIPGSGSTGLPGSSPFPSGSQSPSSSNSSLAKLLATLGLSGLAGGLNNRPTTSTSVPNVQPILQPLQQNLVDSYTKSLLGTDLTGYTASGVDDINSQSAIQKQNAMETAAARGVQGPAVDTSLNNIDASRSSQVSKFRQSIPLLQNTLQQAALSNAGNFFNNNKTGLTTTNSGNVAGGAVSGPASILAYLYATGQL